MARACACYKSLVGAYELVSSKKKSNAVSETQRDAPAVRAASLTHPDHARTALDVGGLH